MAVTIKQIAERAGLSVPTVSRILNNDAELFRVETREKVLSAARELGYRPNSYRMALRTKKFNSIGLLFPAHRSDSRLSHHTLCSLREELQKRNQHLVAGQATLHNGDLGKEQNGDGDAMLPKMLREWSVDGLLIDSLYATPPHVQEMISHTKIPAIWLNVKQDADCVYADEFNGAKQATEILIKKGHQRIFYLDHGALDPSGQRQEGYLAAMKTAGLSTHVFGAENTPKSERAAYFLEWIGKNRGANFPTAIFCENVELAGPFYLAATWAKISIPKDLSILTIHDHDCDTLGISMSAMRLPAKELAIQGLAALDEKIKLPTADVPPKALPLVYEEGTTVGPVPANP